MNKRAESSRTKGGVMIHRENLHLSDKEVNLIKTKLENDLDRIKSNNKVANFSLSQTETKNEVDEANENIMLSYTARQTNRENLYMKKVLKSLKKLSDGRYGVCDDCDAEIPFKRLRARITSELCIVCKEESETTESGTIFGKRSNSLGKGLRFSTSMT